MGASGRSAAAHVTSPEASLLPHTVGSNSAPRRPGSASDCDCEGSAATSSGMGSFKDSAAFKYVSQIPRALGFHVLNSLLGAAGFALILSGSALSIGLLALCFAGVLVFRALLAVAPLILRLDVVLHNSMAPPDRQLCERSVAQVSESMFLQRRLALMAVMYLTTVKMATGVLSALVLALAFALPLNALTSASFRTTYLAAGCPAYAELVATAIVFLAAGLALMPYVARLSCATTRYFCCEAFCTHTYYSSLDAAPRPTARTYGTRGDTR